jgi:phospholipase/lecithinase/hemolysin
MTYFKASWAALGAALLVAACGGGGDGNQAPRVAFTSVVSFGDSLSDAGTYEPGLVKAGIIPNAAAGGMFTVNGLGSTVDPVTLLVTPGAIGSDPVPSYNWAQLVAAAVVGKPSCAARVGGYGLAPSAVVGCTNYAQGGARVQDPRGVGNAVGVGYIAGPLTQPVVTQLANYAADNGSPNFTDKQLVTVLAGANDIFGLTDQLVLDATAAGNAAGAQTFANMLVGSLAADSTVPASAAAAIGSAMAQAQAAAAQVPGATSDSIMTAAVTAAVQAAAAAGNVKVMDMTYIGAAVGPAQVAATTAGNNAFAQALVIALVGGVPTANQAAAMTSIPTAMAQAQAAESVKPGATADSIMNAAVQAALMAAAQLGNATAGAALVAAQAGDLSKIAAITGPAQTTGLVAGATAFTASLTASLAKDATAATAAADIAAAMNSAFAAASHVAGATSVSILTAMGNAGVQAAAADGNSKVMNMTYINGIVGPAQVAATAAGSAAGNQYAATTGAANAVAGMTTAATTLVGYIKNNIVGMGAQYVAVSNLPDVSLTPSAASSPSTQPLILAMTNAFNKALQDGLAGTPGVILIDAFVNLQDQVKNPSRYKLTNVTNTACDMTKVPSSLVCNANTLIAGDTSHYLFADGVHPTPYVHKLQAQLVSTYLAKAGWL